MTPNRKPPGFCSCKEQGREGTSQQTTDPKKPNRSQGKRFLAELQSLEIQ